MHYSISQPQRSPWPVVSLSGRLPGPDATTKAVRDPRWHTLVSRLKALRKRGRRAVRIVDVNCGDGMLLIQAVQQARTLGFLSIEGVGIDGDAQHIGDAQWRSRLLTDSAVGLEFHVGEPAAQLELECEFPADIILYEAASPVPQRLRDALKFAGDFALRARPPLAVARP